jgi:hypothetical protein
MDDDLDNQAQAYDPIVEEFATWAPSPARRPPGPSSSKTRFHARKTSRRYEDYLDSQITATDMYYLEDIHRARYLVELG